LVFPFRYCAAFFTQKGKRRGIVDHDVELLSFQRARVAVEITDELFGDPSFEEAGPRLAAIEECHAMSARDRILDLLRAGEAGAAEDENVERRGCASGIRPRERHGGLEREFRER
jgi:hypothetical protein